MMCLKIDIFKKNIINMVYEVSITVKLPNEVEYATKKKIVKWRIYVFINNEGQNILLNRKFHKMEVSLYQNFKIFSNSIGELL
jgi:hypothetical protein